MFTEIQCNERRNHAQEPGDHQKQSPPGYVTGGLVLEVARTATLPPEVKEGLFPHHNPTSKNLLLFLLGFLFGLFLSCHRHLLLKFPGWASCQEGVKLDSGEEKFSIRTLPYFVGEAIIAIPQIVCQEKNHILEIFFQKIFCINVRRLATSLAA